MQCSNPRFEADPESVPMPGCLALVDRRVIARRLDADDILVEIDPHLCECAEVHLTWSCRKEMNPELPHTELQATMEDWIRERMLPDHEAHTGGGST